MMTANFLVPIPGCFVRQRADAGCIGCVVDRRPVGEQWQLKVQWGSGAQDWVALEPDLEW